MVKEWPITNGGYKSYHGRAYDQKQSTAGRKPGLSFIYFLLYFPFNKKARACSRMYLSFGYFRSLTFLGEDQEEWWTNNTHEHMSYTDYNTSICPDGGTTTEGDLNSIHLKFCKLQVWGRYVSTPKRVLVLNSYFVLELVYVLASCSKKMKKMKKNERSCHGDNIISINKTPW